MILRTKHVLIITLVIILMFEQNGHHVAHDIFKGMFEGIDLHIVSKFCCLFVGIRFELSEHSELCNYLKHCWHGIKSNDIPHSKTLFTWTCGREIHCSPRYLPSCRAINAEVWWLLCGEPEQAVEQTIELTVIFELWRSRDSTIMNSLYIRMLKCICCVLGNHNCLHLVTIYGVYER